MGWVAIPGVADVDCRSIISIANYRMPVKVEQNRVPGINLGLIVCQGKAARIVFGFLVVAVSDGVAAGFIEELASIGAIHF